MWGLGAEKHIRGPGVSRKDPERPPRPSRPPCLLSRARGRGWPAEPPRPEKASWHPARAPPPPYSCLCLPGPKWTEGQRLGHSCSDTVPGPGQVSSRHLLSVGLQGWAVSRETQAHVQSGFRAWTPNAEWDGVRQDPATSRQVVGGPTVSGSGAEGDPGTCRFSPLNVGTPAH